MDPALITGATAVATGLLGYSGARLQHRAEQGHLQVERDRVGLEQVRLEKELEDLQTKRREQATEAKRTLYYEYLDNAEAPWSLCTRQKVVTGGDVDTWWLTYQGVRRQVMIGAAEQVVENVLTVNDHIADIFIDLIEAIEKGNSDRETHSLRKKVWQMHSEKVESSLRELEATMRADVAL